MRYSRCIPIADRENAAVRNVVNHPSVGVSTGVVVLVVLLWPPSMMADSSLDVIQEVFLAMDSELVSGEYSGEFSARVGGVVVTRASVSVRFDEGKYRVDLKYSDEPLHCDRRVIVYDGEVIGASRFSSGISVTGSEGEIFTPRPTATDLVSPKMAEFPWDPARLHRQFVHVVGLVKNVASTLTSERDEVGDIVLKYKSGPMTPVTLRFPKDYGYRVGAMEVMSAGGGVVHRYEIEWRAREDTWFISRFLEEWPSEGRSWELRVAEATIGIVPDSSSFALAALDLPQGARVIDRTNRSGDVASKLHYIPVSDDQIEAATAAVLADATRFPNIRARSINGAAASKSAVVGGRSWFLIVIANLVVLCLLFCFARHRTRSMHSED